MSSNGPCPARCGEPADERQPKSLLVRWARFGTGAAATLGFLCPHRCVRWLVEPSRHTVARPLASGVDRRTDLEHRPTNADASLSGNLKITLFTFSAPVMKPIISGFEKANPNVHVSSSVVSNGNTLRAAVADREAGGHPA